MDRYIVRPHRLTLMQDPGLARSEAAATRRREGEGRLAADPERRQAPTDGAIIAGFLRSLWCELATAWRQAARRGPAVRELKRVDRRMLRDLGLERAAIRDLVDDLAARQAAAADGERAPAVPPLLTTRPACS